MFKWSQRVGPFARTTTVMVIVVGLTGFALVASAASLGGIGVGSIFTQETAVDIDVPDPPGPIVSTDFSGCTNFIDGWTDGSGATWTSHSGNWQCLGHDVVRAQRRVSFANLTVGIEHSTGIRVSTDIFDISHQANRSGPGLALLHDGAGDYLYVIYRRDDQELSIGVSGEGRFAVVSGLGDLDTGVMSASIVGDDLYVDFAGAMVGPFDLNDEAPDLLGNTRFGLVADKDNFSKFNNFTIELLP